MNNKIKKTLLKMVIWMEYILCLPLFVVFTIVVLIVSCIGNKKTFGEFDVIETTKALFDGYQFGHLMNMSQIDELFDDESEEDLSFE